MTEQFEKAIQRADDLETKVIYMKVAKDYTDVCKITEFAAMAIRQEIPMYTGNINPKWQIYDDVVAIIKGRKNGRT